MRTHLGNKFSAVVLAGLLCVPVVTLVGANPRDPVANPAIDMEGYLRVSREASVRMRR